MISKGLFFFYFKKRHGTNFLGIRQRANSVNKFLVVCLCLSRFHSVHAKDVFQDTILGQALHEKIGVRGRCFIKMQDRVSIYHHYSPLIWFYAKLKRHTRELARSAIRITPLRNNRRMQRSSQETHVLIQPLHLRKHRHMKRKRTRMHRHGTRRRIRRRGGRVHVRLSAFALER